MTDIAAPLSTVISTRSELELEIPAARKYLEDNTERAIKLEPEHIGLNFLDDQVYLMDRQTKQSYLVDKTGTSRLLDVTRIPIPFLKNDCDNMELRDNIIKFCLGKLDSPMTAVVRQGEIKNVLPTVVNLATTIDIFNAIEPLIPNAIVRDIALNGAVRLKITSRDSQRSAGELKGLKKQDLLEAGLFVNIGKTIKMGSYLWRLVCSNGATRIQYSKSFEATSDKDAIPLLKMQARQAFEFAHKTYMDEMLRTKELQVEDPSVMINRFASVHRIADEARLELIARVPSLVPPVTYYDVINLITEFARDCSRVGDHALEDRLTGFADEAIKESTHRLCRSCYKPV